MAQRVSSAEVRAICDLDETVSLQPFIDTASLLVDEDLSGSGYSTARLKQLELYLAAHFACLNDPRLVEMGTGADRIKFEAGPMGAGLRSTRYGQQALLLDTAGTLARLAEGAQRARFEVLTC